MPKCFQSLTPILDFGKSNLLQSPSYSVLTTFITPYGRFCFNRLPFGITSAPEHFQRRMSEILQGLEGVVCLVDDILVYGSTQAEHDAHLKAAL